MHNYWSLLIKFWPDLEKTNLYWLESTKIFLQYLRDRQKNKILITSMMTKNMKNNTKITKNLLKKWM